MKSFFLVPLLLMSVSCQPDEKYSCDELSMMKYKGVPLSSKRFEEQCKGAKITYTKELCQEALTELMRTNSLAEVKAEFGDPVENCFTAADLNRFNKQKN